MIEIISIIILIFVLKLIFKPFLEYDKDNDLWFFWFNSFTAGNKRKYYKF